MKQEDIEKDLKALSDKELKEHHARLHQIWNIRFFVGTGGDEEFEQKMRDHHHEILGEMQEREIEHKYLENELDTFSLEYGTKPYPNEHACRLRNPDDFKKGSFRRMTREHKDKKYSVIMGRLKNQVTLTEQAYRYNKVIWEAAEARKHCGDHKGRFEPAIGKEIKEIKILETELNSPSLAHLAVFGKKPDEFIRGRAGHPTKKWNGIDVDEHLKDKWLNELNGIKGIELRASCEGHYEDDVLRPTYLVFRLMPANDDKAGRVAKILSLEDGVYSIADKGSEGRPRIIAAAKPAYGSSGWEKFWSTLAGKIKNAVEKGTKELTPEEWEAEYSGEVPHWAIDKNPSLFAQEFVGELKKQKAKRVLEIGCGNGRDSIFFSYAGFDVAAVDVSSHAIKLAEKNADDAKVIIDFQEANAEELPFKDGEFDAVFSLSVLHSTKLTKSVPEVNRMLSENGLAFIYIYGDTQHADGKQEEVITVDKYLELLKTLNFTVLDFYSEQEEKFDEFGEKHKLLVALLQKKAGKPE